MRDRVLQFIANLVWRRSLAIVVFAIALAALCAWYAASNLILNANTDDLVAPDRPYMIEYRRLLEEFGDLEHIFVVVEDQGHPQRTEAVVDALTSKLRVIPDLPAVHSAIEPHEQLALTTRAMPEDELADFALASGGFESLASGDAGRVIHQANELLTRLIQSGAQMDVQEQRRTGAAAIFLVKAVAAAHHDSSSRSDLQFLIQPPPREYFKSDTGRFYFIDITPSKDYSTLSVVEEPLRKIRAAIDEIRREFPDMTIGLTGKPVLQADEMATSNADMTKAATLAFILCAALFMISFGGFWKPLLAVIAFACAGAWTYGFATLSVGQLNLLSIVFMLVLIGVGLDYGVHILTRYREFRVTLNVRDSITQAIITAGRGNITGALTSAAVFFMALATSFQGLRELGLIAGAGLLLCVTAMTIVLPALLAIVEKSKSRKVEKSKSRQVDKSTQRQGGESKASDEFGVTSDESGQSSHSSFVIRHSSRVSRFTDAIFNSLHERPLVVLIVAGALSLGLIFAPGVWRFEHNLLELQAQGLESVEWERRILEDSAAASWFGAIIADSQDQALDIVNRARGYESIGAIRSVFDLIQPQTPRRDDLRQQLHRSLSSGDSVADAATMSSAGGSAGMSDAQTWSVNDLQKAASALDLMAVGAARQAPDEARILRQLSADLKTLVAPLQREESASATRSRIEQTIAASGESLRIILEGNAADLRAALPAALRDQYISEAGRFLIMLHPRENVWELEPMQQFVANLQAVEPSITGAPISHLESLGDMQRAFVQMALMSLAAIALLLWLDFRSVKLAGLALLPTVFGLMWLFEIMALLGISFNLANFFSVPILIGLSVDGSVHVLHRFLERRGRTVNLGSTRTAVIVTALTTTIGFGCMIIAQHRGLRSLGQVMAIGSVTCLLASIILLPAILAVLERRGQAESRAARGRSN